MHVKGNVANTYMHFGFVYVEYIQEKSHVKKNQVHLLGKKKKHTSNLVMKPGMIQHYIIQIHDNAMWD